MSNPSTSHYPSGYSFFFIHSISFSVTRKNYKEEKSKTENNQPIIPVSHLVPDLQKLLMECNIRPHNAQKTFGANKGISGQFLGTANFCRVWHLDISFC